jgi:hypothetical protein
MEDNTGNVNTSVENQEEGGAGITNAGSILSPAEGDWRTNLPDPIRSEKALSTFKDVGSLAKSYLEMTKLQGNSIRLPGPDAKEDDWNRIFTKLGRPEAPDKYEVAWPENVPGVFEWSDETKSEFLAEAHKAGLNNRQVQNLLDWNARSATTIRRNVEALGEQTVSELREKWGGNYERNISVSQRAAQKLGGQELIDILESTGLGNHKVFIELFHRIGKMMIEDEMMPAEFDGIQNGEDALAEVQKIMGDAKGPYWNRQHPEHDSTVAKVKALFERAYNE